MRTSVQLSGLFVVLSLAACAAPQRPATTTITAAQVESSPAAPAAEKEAAPAATPATAASVGIAATASETSATSPSAPAADTPAGELVCKATTPDGVKAELYLDWKGTSATGTVRRTAASGMVYLDPVRGERYNSMIVVDTPSNDDLTAHTALIASKDGKQYMRLGDVGERWLRCE